MVDRIQLILKVYNLTASRFADEIGVQRSAISHILSGRNMPSLDLVQKILKRYTDINSEWLLNGIGSMSKGAQPDLFNSDVSEPIVKDTLSEDTILSEKTPSLDEVKSQNINEVENDSGSPKASENPIHHTNPEDQEEKVPEIKLKSSANVSARKVEKAEIEKIVIFYSNKTFREYFPE